VDARPNPDLTEIRDAINVIDERIVKLIGERQAWVEQAGRLKRNQGEDAVRAPARVDAVISRVRLLAVPAGASPEVVERIYRALIASFVDLELESTAARAPALTNSDVRRRARLRPTHRSLCRRRPASDGYRDVGRRASIRCRLEYAMNGSPLRIRLSSSASLSWYFSTGKCGTHQMHLRRIHTTAPTA